MSNQQAVRRVIVTGAESTGSTTLAQALATALDCAWVPEFGRAWSAMRPGGLEAAWRDAEFVHIAATQNRLEDIAAGKAGNGWLVCDTDALSTVLWQERYMGRSTDAVRVIAARQARPFARILTGDEIPFVQDGLRDGEHIRHSMQQRFREALAGEHAGGVPWIEVRGSLEQRLEESMAFLHRLASSHETG